MPWSWWLALAAPSLGILVGVYSGGNVCVVLMMYHNCSVQGPRYGHIEVVLDGKRRHQRSTYLLFHRDG